MAQTVIKRIDLANANNLEQDLKNLCEGLQALGLGLAATFEAQNQLILIFQD